MLEELALDRRSAAGKQIPLDRVRDRNPGKWLYQ